MNVDSSGTAAESIFDLISLAASILDVATNPSDPWAWAGLAGDIIDVAIPFVGGIGETVKATSTALKIADTADDVRDTSKAVEVLIDTSEGLCFVAGTVILTSSGKRAIETIQSGDYVWAWDEATNDVALKKVVETYVNQTDELIHIFVNGEEIITTPSHPFYSPVKGWTDAVRLRAGDMLLLVNGEYVVVEKVQHEILEAPVTVYNFQVEDYHTYYVADSGILVHNSCSSNFKRIDPEYFEKANHLKKGTFHRHVKPTILKAEKPTRELVGNNPDILMNRSGQIAYQNVRDKKKMQLTELFMGDILNKIT